MDNIIFWYGAYQSKLNKRESQRYLRDTLDSIVNLLEKINSKFPKEDERYFEI